MLHGNHVVLAYDLAFHQGPEALDALRVDRPAHPFLFGVRHYVMLPAKLAELRIGAVFVGVDHGILGHVALGVRRS